MAAGFELLRPAYGFLLLRVEFRRLDLLSRVKRHPLPTDTEAEEVAQYHFEELVEWPPLISLCSVVDVFLGRLKGLDSLFDRFGFLVIWSLQFG